MTNQTPRPTVAEFLNRKFSATGKTQTEVAAEIGFVSDKIVTAILTGIAQLPINKIIPFAHAVDVDPGHLLRLVLDEYLPGLHGVIEECLGSELLTKREMALVTAYRDFADTDEVVTLMIDPTLAGAIPVEVKRAE